ncbi:hypothetical protein C4G99_RS17510 [Vibrio parahaemolyticus]|nr:hypothetical protein [Vibrio parahaemolyticus]EJG1046810.1 hypothetical protein [Vibrio parahaemolyticus]EJG1080836.1 hypothetical protein [Vibrio parahaemolyticus]EJG1095345.1 hypothetical protein [Vibrio parahaemolyticus]
MDGFQRLEGVHTAQKSLIQLYKLKVDVLEERTDRISIEEIDENIEVWTKKLEEHERALNIG